MYFFLEKNRSFLFHRSENVSCLLNLETKDIRRKIRIRSNEGECKIQLENFITGSECLTESSTRNCKFSPLSPCRIY